MQLLSKGGYVCEYETRHQSIWHMYLSGVHNITDSWIETRFVECDECESIARTLVADRDIKPL